MRAFRCYPLFVTVVAVTLLWSALAHTASAADTNRIFSVQNRAASPPPSWQLLLNVKQDSSLNSSNPLYTLHGVYGMAFLGETLYATELDNGGVDWYLATIPHEGPTAGFGARVSANPIGLPNVEGLAAVDGVLYGSSLVYGAHVSGLITIDPVTGIGSQVGTMGTDVMIVGLAYDSVNGVLYGAGIAFASEPNANLYIIDPNTAQATLVGPFNLSSPAPIQGFAWDADLGLIGAFEKLYSINTQTGAATQIGATDFSGGLPGTVNGLWGLSAYVPPGLGPVAPITLTLLGITNGDVSLAWTSESGSSYQVEARGSLPTGTWTNASGSIPATSGTTPFLHIGGANHPQMLYRVKKLP